MKKNFKTDYVDGRENVMKVDTYVSEVRYDIESRTISIVYSSNVYTNEDLDHLSWWKLKRLVTEHGGEWTTMKAAIAFLVGKEKINGTTQN